MNFNNGTSEQDIYNPSARIDVQFSDYSGANETGTLMYQGDNYTAGNSEIVFFNDGNGVSQETDSFAGAYGTGNITSADLDLTNGFSLDYTFTYDGNGTETSYNVDEYNASDQLVWYGQYNPTGGYISGGGDPGYSGPGGYYGGGDGGYGGGDFGGGYDFVNKGISSASGRGADISDLARYDTIPTGVGLKGAGQRDEGHAQDNSLTMSGNSSWNPATPFSRNSVTSPAASGRRGINIGVIAAYDEAASAEPAARAAEAARHQAMQAAEGNGGLGYGGAQFEGAIIHGGVITWSLATTPGTNAAPFSGYIADPYKAAIENAFQGWASATGLTFKEVPDGASSDIRVGWGTFDTNTSGVIGYTSYRQHSGAMQPGTIIRLEDPAQDTLITGPDGQLIYSGTQAELSQVAMHEIGHALGLADTADPNAIMAYASGASNRTLDQTDIAGIQSLYGTTSAGMKAAIAVHDPLADLSASLSSAMRWQPSIESGTPDARLGKMIQAMSTVHESGGGWSESSQTPFAPAPEPTITIASHPH